MSIAARGSIDYQHKKDGGYYRYTDSGIKDNTIKIPKVNLEYKAKAILISMCDSSDPMFRGYAATILKIDFGDIFDLLMAKRMEKDVLECIVLCGMPPGKPEDPNEYTRFKEFKKKWRKYRVYMGALRIRVLRTTHRNGKLDRSGIKRIRRGGMRIQWIRCDTINYSHPRNMSASSFPSSRRSGLSSPLRPSAVPFVSKNYDACMENRDWRRR